MHSSVHRTVSSHGHHHLHSGGASALNDRTGRSSTQPKTQRSRSMTEQENMAATIAQVHQLTQWVGDLLHKRASTATATATAPHKKRSEDREVRRQQISQLERRHQSCSRNQTNRHRGNEWAERQRSNAIDATAITSAHIMEAADNEILHAYILVRTTIHRQRKLGQRSPSVAKVRTQIRFRNGEEPDWPDVEILQTNQRRPTSSVCCQHWKDEKTRSGNTVISKELLC